MEYCSEGTLSKVCREGLELSCVRRYTHFLLQAVDYLHKKLIVHRDIKAENILLTDNRQKIKLIDFGLAAKPVGGINTFLHTNCGSFFYAAPEVINVGYLIIVYIYICIIIVLAKELQ